MILPEWLQNLWEKKPMNTVQATDDDGGKDNGSNFWATHDFMDAMNHVATEQWRSTAKVKERVCDFARARLDANGYKDRHIVDVCRHRLADGRAIFIVATQGFNEVQLMPSMTMRVPMLGHCLIIEDGDGFAVVDDDQGGDGA